MKNVAFTIVAKNYIGLAMVLERSFKATPDAAFYIFVADEFVEGDKEAVDLPGNVLFAKQCSGIDERRWKEMAFKYNLVEFCTAIKPSCFNYLFAQGAEKVIYLDPDVFVFRSLQPVYTALDDTSVLVTPHITGIHVPYNGDHPDYLFLVNGIFNLGFLAVRNTAVARQMILWWQDRLYHQCFFDNEKGFATDQKWMNMLPCLLPEGELKISRDMGLNMAPWNLFERKIIIEGADLYVVPRNGKGEEFPLSFVHFSGYNYKSLINNIVHHKNEDLVNYADMQPVYDRYAAALNSSEFKKYIHLRYTYNYFNNGKNIISINRRILRRMIDEQANNYDDPFDTGTNSFYNKLKKSRLIDHSVTSADSVTNKNVGGFKKKMRLVNVIFKATQRVIGIRRYSILARFLRRYFMEENQYFLFDNKTRKDFY